MNKKLIVIITILTLIMVYGGITDVVLSAVGSPNVTIQSPTNGTNVSSALQAFNATIIDFTGVDDVFFMFNTNGTPFNATATNVSGNWNTNVNMSSIDEGLHTITVFANDTTNNVNNSETVQILVDRSSPTVTLINTTFNTSDNTPLFGYNFSDLSRSANCSLYIGGKLNTSQFTSNATYTTITAGTLNDDTYTVSINCTDGSGNKGNSSVINITIDTNASTVSLINSTSFNTTDTTISIHFNFTDTSISANCSLYVAGNWNSSLTVQNGTNSILNTSVLKNGSYSISVNCTDGSGNTGNSTVINISVDTDYPVIHNVNLSDRYVKSGESVNIQVNASDLVTGVYSLSVNGTNLTKLSNNLWNGSLTIPSGSGLTNLTVYAVDFVGHSVTNSTFQYKIDNTNPVIYNALITRSNLNETPTINHTDGNITINWTVRELNLSVTNISIDNGAVVNYSVSNGTNFFNCSLDGGYHSVKIQATDEAGNVNTIIYYFNINAKVNLNTTLGKINTSSTIMNNYSLRDSNGNDISRNNTYLNRTLNLVLNITLSNASTKVTIANFSGLNANWNNTFKVNNSLSAASNAVHNLLGSNLTQLVFLRNFSNFLNDTFYSYGEIIFRTNVSTDNDVSIVYFGSDNESNVTKITTTPCAGSYPCYFVNSTTKFTHVRLPHFSGAGIVNDTIAPIINLTHPINSSTYNYSYNINYTGNISEINAPTDIDTMCNYSVDSTDIGKSLNLTAALGYRYTFTIFNASVFSNGNHFILINCTDTRNNSRQIRHNFTIADGAYPVITSISEAVSSTSAIVTVVTDEPSNYSLSYGTTNKTLTSYVRSNTTWGVSDSISITGLSASTTYYYNVTTCDVYGNCITNGTYNFTTEATTSSSTTSSSSSGGGGSSSSQFSDYAKKVWAVVNPNEPAILPINSDEVGLSSVSLYVKNKQYGVWMKISKVDTLPSKITPITKKLFKYVEVTKSLTLDAKEIEKVEFKFKVNNAWIKENGLDNSKISLYEFTDNNWKNLETTYLEKDTDYSYYESIGPGFSLFAIAEGNSIVNKEDLVPKQEEVQEETKEETKEEVKEKEIPVSKPKFDFKNVWIILIGLLIIGLIYLVFLKIRNMKDLSNLNKLVNSSKKVTNKKTKKKPTTKN